MELHRAGAVMGTASNYGEEFPRLLTQGHPLDEAPTASLVVDGNGYTVSVNEPFFGVWNIPVRR